MMKLIVKHNGQILQEAPLQSAEEYSIGRGKDNNIVLPEQAGISRKHLSLSIGEDGQWTVKNLSATGELIIDGTAVEEGAISLGSSFQTQGFEFILVQEDKKSSQKSTEKPLDQKLPSEQKLAPADPQSIALYKRTESQLTKAQKETEEKDSHQEDKLLNVSSDDSSSALSLADDDKTKILPIDSSSARMSAYLKVSDDTDNMRDIFKLEEDQSEWIVGRDETADIMVENPNISRKHFKIIKEERDYVIEDLKSSNGTVLNDKDLKPGKSYTLHSGDMIYILDIEMVFEIKNLSLEKELAQMKLSPPALRQSPEGLLPTNHPTAGGWPVTPNIPQPLGAPGVIVEMPDHAKSPLAFVKKNKKRLSIYGAVLLAVLSFVFFNTEEEPDSGSQMVVAGGGELAGLSEQEINLVENTYMSARLLFSQGKFELCSSEIKKIHKYTNSYQDSKKLHIACTQAMDNQKRQHDMEHKRKKAIKTDKLIQKITDKCREKFDTFKFEYELKACLQSATELSPADERIHALTDQFTTNETLKKEQERQRAERRKFIQSIASKYHYAKSLYKKGQTLKAISAYQNFINVSRHQELKQERAKAQRELASIKQKFQDRNNKMESSCKSHFKAKNFQKAYHACDKAVDKIPEPHNKNARRLRDSAQNKLELVMKPLYESANLNESVGNVSKAQEDWNKILQLDVPTGIYYKRAKAKLSKY